MTERKGDREGKVNKGRERQSRAMTQDVKWERRNIDRSVNGEISKRGNDG